ncbi:hypothetical protein Nepgr_019524 [Nepenthes gracilis]|uniref:BHLH domain-containing protein n=1 Tax=Nepenthes gracilis TaxID=150966 RepID=A0AAD3XUG6_NEPGR|nr:hypothetical protein Nepgr_019524 [Nepenthes gracilis]
MMAGNPNWRTMHSMRSSHDHQQPSTNTLIPQTPLLFPLQFLHGSSSLPFNPSAAEDQDFPQSWSQLLLGGLDSHEEDRLISPTSHFQSSSLESREHNISPVSPRVLIVSDMKQEVSQSNGCLYCHEEEEEEAAEAAAARATAWSHIMASSSPRSCGSTNMLDFSNKSNGREIRKHLQASDHSSECNSTTATAGGVPKKARVVQSSSTSSLKVRKEKLGDRITALHQLVSPFGKTDTASVLLEALGYIRFLQGQIEALSSPYLGNKASAKTHHCDNYSRDGQRNDMKSRGLCLVPISCTQQLVESDNGADYWAPASF